MSKTLIQQIIETLLVINSMIFLPFSHLIKLNFLESTIMKTVNIAAIVIATLFTIPAFTQNTNTPKIDKREANQQGRIADGINSGALTAKEAGNLEKREAKIATDEQAAKADDKVTRAERTKMRREENRTSKRIYKQKHDASTTTPAN